jgi:acyl-CoA synthetase (AMP-forming)/AMP-acid ligase II
MISDLRFDSSEVALFAGSRQRLITYRELGFLVEAHCDLLRRIPRPAVAFQFAPNSVSAIAAYLACLAEKIPLGLGGPALTTRNRIIAAYRPTTLILARTESAPEGYECIGEPTGSEMAIWRRRRGGYPVVPHPDLALLLATSGTLGDPKFVRLTEANLTANALSIAKYLSLGHGERAILGLPMHHSYGLSIVNSHLESGGSVALTEHAYSRPEFWKIADECACTSFSGVPYMYEKLRSLGMTPVDCPTVRTLTQAGARLRVELVRHFLESVGRKRGRMFVMYGQTEASPRISYVPPERLAEKPDSIGVAIPGGELWLEPVEGEPSEQQIHYKGPNVMLGYAYGPDDLAKGDEQKGVLATGDLGEKDGEGFFRITGRLGREVKLHGKRVDLGRLESELEKTFGFRTAIISVDDRLRVHIENTAADAPQKIRLHLSCLLGVPLTATLATSRAQIPLTASGKKDYKSLQ